MELPPIGSSISEEKAAQAFISEIRSDIEKSWPGILKVIEKMDPVIAQKLSSNPKAKDHLFYAVFAIALEPIESIFGPKKGQRLRSLCFECVGTDEREPIKSAYEKYTQTYNKYIVRGSTGVDHIVPAMGDILQNEWGMESAEVHPEGEFWAKNQLVSGAIGTVIFGSLSHTWKTIAGNYKIKDSLDIHDSLREAAEIGDIKAHFSDPKFVLKSIAIDVYNELDAYVKIHNRMFSWRTSIPFLGIFFNYKIEAIRLKEILSNIKEDEKSVHDILPKLDESSDLNRFADQLLIYVQSLKDTTSQLLHIAQSLIGKSYSLEDFKRAHSDYQKAAAQYQLDGVKLREIYNDIYLHE